MDRCGCQVVKWIHNAACDWTALCRREAGATGHTEKRDLVPEWVWSDRRIIMAAMRQNPEVLKHAALHVRADREVVLLGLRFDWDRYCKVPIGFHVGSHWVTTTKSIANLCWNGF